MADQTQKAHCVMSIRFSHVAIFVLVDGDKVSVEITDENSGHAEIPVATEALACELAKKIESAIKATCGIPKRKLRWDIHGKNRGAVSLDGTAYDVIHRYTCYERQRRFTYALLVNGKFVGGFEKVSEAAQYAQKHADGEV